MVWVWIARLRQTIETIYKSFDYRFIHRCLRMRNCARGTVSVKYAVTKYASMETQLTFWLCGSISTVVTEL